MEDPDPSPIAKLLAALVPLIGADVHVAVLSAEDWPIAVMHGPLRGSCDLDPLDPEHLTLAIGGQLVGVELAEIVGVWPFETGDDTEPAARGVVVWLRDGRSIELQVDPIALGTWR